MGAQWKAKGKEAAANAKGRIFTKLAKEIMVAARNGPNPGHESAPAPGGGAGEEGIHAQGHPRTGDQEGRRPAG